MEVAQTVRSGRLLRMSEIVLMGDPQVADLPVREVDDDLVDVRSIADLALDGLKAQPDGAYAHLRSGLVERLLFAQERLPDEYRLLLVEGYRPYELQERYFTGYRQHLETLDPTLDGRESFRLASRYVSPPVVAPHVSGAAIDLTLMDRAGEQVDMGTVINATPEDSAGGCYFSADNISSEARHHRDVLAAALTSAGLVNYPTEWWHWSFGDRYWALMTGRPAAIYGPVRGLDTTAVESP
jgi:D-alanyl-D-alanine dipeptidase